MNRLSEAAAARIAAAAGISVSAVRRLAGSVKVSAREREFDLGLRIPEIPLREEDIASALRDYLSCCPKVAGWIASGGFVPSRLPGDVTYARLLHACRSSGRIRAELLRR